MNPGFYKSLPIEKYLSAPGLSKTGLTALSVSPAHYQSHKVTPKQFAAADMGHAVHALVLEPERAERIIVTPPANVLDKRGGRAGTAYKEWEASLPGGTVILRADDYEAARYMRDAVFAHPAAAAMLKNGNPEVSAFFEDALSIMRKCRPDWLADEDVIDLKTAESASPEVFARQAYNLKYHWSAAWTLDIIRGLTGSNGRRYIFIVVEKSPPWAVACYEVPEKVLDVARDEIAPLLAAYKACTVVDRWPAYSDKIETLNLPPWAVKKQEGN